MLYFHKNHITRLCNDRIWIAGDLKCKSQKAFTSWFRQKDIESALIYHKHYFVGDPGIFVSKIKKHGAADRAGLEIGDKIIAVRYLL